jgi:hypothetical protein
VGCTPSDARPNVIAPATGARAWAQAVERDDPKAAYALLADGVRRKVTYSMFAREWQETKQERQRQAAQLAAALRDGVVHGERGRLVLADGKSTVLVHESAGWRLDSPLLALGRASSPQEALRQLAAALEARSFDAVMRVLTSTRRDGLRQVLDTFVTGLRAHMGESIEVTGDRATVTWSDGKRRWRVILKREDGEWRIDDFAPQ